MKNFIKNYFLHLFLLIIILIIVGLEVVLKINLFIGAVAYGFLIALIILLLSKADFSKTYPRLIILFMIVPIVRLAVLFLDISFFQKIIITYIFLYFLVASYYSRLKIKLEYSKKHLKFLVLSIPLGIILGYTATHFLSFEKNLWFLALLPIIAYSEEFLFRGMIQKHLKEVYSPQTAILLTSVLYAVFSLSYGINAVLLFLIISLLTGLIYDQTDNIILPISLNMMVHLFLLVVPIF